MIIIGYQGIGKSSLSNPYLGYIDPECEQALDWSYEEDD